LTALCAVWCMCARAGCTHRATAVACCRYVAPELLKEGSAHGKAVDWWAMGTLLYEMLHGLPPFYSQNTAEMYDMIAKAELVPLPLNSRAHLMCTARLACILRTRSKIPPVRCSRSTLRSTPASVLPDCSTVTRLPASPPQSSGPFVDWGAAVRLCRLIAVPATQRKRMVSGRGLGQSYPQGVSAPGLRPLSQPRFMPDVV